MNLRADLREIPACWNAYVASGHDRDERARRVADVPEDFRACVESHVRLVFALRGQAAMKRLQQSDHETKRRSA